MSSCRWQQAELSIGTQCPSLDRLGIYKCWTIKDKSPAALVWKELLGSIVTLLEDQYEHLDAKDSEFMVDMFMVGRKASGSVPTILICCESKAPRQKAMDLVKKMGILDRHPGLRMAEISRLPRRLALDEDYELPHLAPGVYLNGPLRSCGIDVLISQDPLFPPRKATIGGIIRIEDDFYGLTVAHAFEKVKVEEPHSNQDFEFAFYGLGQLDDSSDDESDSTITSQGSVSSGSSNSLDSDKMEISDVSLPYNPDAGYFGPDLKAVGSARIQKFSEPIRFGSLFESALPENPHDWALVKIDNIRAIKSDYRLFSDLLVNKVHSAHRCIYPNALRVGEGGRVLICLRSLETAAEGTMSGVSSFFKLPGCDIFQELWQVSRIDGSFVDGDCGAWVIDFDTGDLLGHIVSGYCGSQIAYIIPAEQIFRDISNCLGRPVELSTLSRRDPRARIRVPAMDPSLSPMRYEFSKSISASEGVEIEMSGTSTHQKLTRGFRPRPPQSSAVSTKSTATTESIASTNSSTSAATSITSTQSFLATNRSLLNDSSDDELSDEDDNRTLKQPSRFACPFHIHDPEKFNNGSCAASSWESINRLKEHLYRCHTHVCLRCCRAFKNKKELDSHWTQINSCEPGFRVIEGITPDIKKMIRTRRKVGDDRSERGSWEAIYRLLFPGEDVPSPYFETSDFEMSDFETYQQKTPTPLHSEPLNRIKERLQRELSSLVRNSDDTLNLGEDALDRLTSNINDRISQVFASCGISSEPFETGSNASITQLSSEYQQEKFNGFNY